MKEAEKILSEMEEILNLLIENAKNMLELSKRAIAEEELEPLQKRQEEFVSLLMEKDQAFHKIAQSSKELQLSPIRDRIDEKLEQFKKLNANFIDNIVTIHGLIQFEKGHIKKHTK